jgi:nitrogen regulatory protein PII
MSIAIFIERTYKQNNYRKMKAVFVIFNQANSERVQYMLDRLGIRGYTWWEEVQGRGSIDGEPRYGTHTWPEMNSAVITMIPEEQVAPLLEAIKKLDNRNKEIGVRAFVWSVETMI